MAGVIRSSSATDGREVREPRKSLRSDLFQVSMLIKESIRWGATRFNGIGDREG